MTILGLEKKHPYAIRLDDRRRHFYVLGQTGTGKSTFFVNLIAQDLEEGHGLCVLDPHGQTVLDALSVIPERRFRELLYLNATDLEHPVAFNPLERIPVDRRDQVASDIVSAFHAIHADSWGPQMEWIFLNAVRLVLDVSGTLLDVRRVLLDETFRKTLERKATSAVNRSFWRDEYDAYFERGNDPRTPILNKLGRVLSSPHLRNILGQKHSSFNLRRIMDEERIMIVNLSKSALGERNSHLLGALLVSSIAHAAFSRDDTPEHERKLFHLYVDEFQNFTTSSFSLILSEARKFGLSLTIANQFLAQLPDALRNAVLGNVGSVLAFRVGAEDAPLVSKHLGWSNPDELQSMANYTARGRFLEHGSPTSPIYLTMLDPAPATNGKVAEMVSDSRSRFGRDRQIVEAQIEADLIQKPPKPKPKRRAWP
jgi:DNA helicase HerA-like ATPase